jgi:hypothetical protein
MEISDYSEKAIVLRGEKTKDCTDGLKEMGGKFNAVLKGGPGWIFPKTKREIIEKFVNEGVVTKSEYRPSGTQTTQYKPSEAVKRYSVNSFNDKIVDGNNLIEKLDSKIEELTKDIADLKTLIGLIRKGNRNRINKKEEQKEEDFPEIVLEEEMFEEEEEEIKPKKKLLSKKY